MRRSLAVAALAMFLSTAIPAQAVVSPGPLLTGPISVDRYSYSFPDVVKKYTWQTPKGATIRADQYLINLADVREAFVSAHRRGVNVQVVMDGDAALGADLPGSTARQYKFLKEELGTDKSKSSWVYLCRASCFSNVVGANMHAKTVLFSQTGVTKNVSIVGSANLAETNTLASWNENVVYKDINLYNGLVRYHTAMSQDKVRPWGKRIVSVDKKTSMWLYPGVPNVIQSHFERIHADDCRAGTSIDISNFIWSDGAVEKAKRLRALWIAGCRVRVALNLSTANPHVGAQVAHQLFTPYKGRYMNVRDTRTSSCCYSHLKLTLIKTPRMTTVYGGSANFTGSNRRINSDILTVDTHVTTYNKYLTYYNWMFKNTKVASAPKINASTRVNEQQVN